MQSATHGFSIVWLVRCLVEIKWADPRAMKSAWQFYKSKATGRQLLEQNALFLMQHNPWVSSENMNWPKPEGTTAKMLIYMHCLLSTSCCFHCSEWRVFYAVPFNRLIWVSLTQFLEAGGHNLMSRSELAAFEPLCALFYIWLLSTLADVSLQCTKWGLKEEC